MRAHIAASHAAIALVLLSPLLSCSTEEERSTQRTATTAPANRAPAAGPDADGAKVRLHDAAGVVLLEIKPKDDGFKLEDAKGARVVKAKKKDNGFELRGAAGATLAKVKVRDGKLAVETEDGVRLLDVKGTTDARAGQWLALERFSLLERALSTVLHEGGAEPATPPPLAEPEAGAEELARLVRERLLIKR